MKKSMVAILAALVILPLLARSQKEVKVLPSENERSRSAPSPDLTTQDLATINDFQKSGDNSGDYVIYEASSIYLEPGWDKGYAVLNDKTVLNEIMLRYDIYHQQMQFIDKVDTLAFSNPEELDYLYIGNRKFVYTEYESDGVIRKGFFEVLHEGRCPLYLHRIVKYHLDPECTSSLKEDLYVRECGYYVKKEGAMAKPIRPNRKSILCVFRDKEREVADFMDDNKLSGKTCDDLKLVIAFYDSLP